MPHLRLLAGSDTRAWPRGDDMTCPLWSEFPWVAAGGPWLHHSCFLRTWIGARHGRQSTLVGCPSAQVSLGFLLQLSHLWGLPLETGESKIPPGCFFMVGWGAGEGRY